MRTLLVLLLLAITAAAAPPKPPALLIGTGDAVQRVELTLEHPIPILPGWVRLDARPAPGLVAQAFASRDNLLVDVFNVGPAVHLAFEGAAGEGLEFQRLVPTWCGIAWSHKAPTKTATDPPAGAWDAAYAPQPWHVVDVGWTPTTGSPRNRFFSAHRWRAAHGDVTRAMEAGLDRHVRWQLMRPLQQPDELRALPRIMVGQAAPWVKHVTYPDIGSVTPGDTHHWTVGELCDAFLLTGDPRAFDQVVRAMTYMLATQDYWRVDWHWPYGGAERVPGWLLCSLADAGEVFDAAGYRGLYEWTRDQAQAHVELLTKLGLNELGLPNVVAAPDAGRHLPCPWNAPWQGAIVAFGLLRVDQVFGVPGAAPLAQRWLDYLEQRGWDGVGVVFDSVPHNPEDQAVAPRAAGVPGIGMWLAPPLILGGRMESPLLAFLIERAKGSKYYGQVLFSPGGSLSLFAPLFPNQN